MVSCTNKSLVRRILWISYRVYLRDCLCQSINVELLALIHIVKELGLDFLVTRHGSRY